MSHVRHGQEGAKRPERLERAIEIERALVRTRRPAPRDSCALPTPADSSALPEHVLLALCTASPRKRWRRRRITRTRQPPHSLAGLPKKRARQGPRGLRQALARRPRASSPAERRGVCSCAEPRGGASWSSTRRAPSGAFGVGGRAQASLPEAAVDKKRARAEVSPPCVTAERHNATPSRPNAV